MFLRIPTPDLGYGATQTTRINSQRLVVPHDMHLEAPDEMVLLPYPPTPSLVLVLTKWYC
eukprot:1213866-Rhodomonas_salina.1